MYYSNFLKFYLFKKISKISWVKTNLNSLTHPYHPLSSLVINTQPALSLFNTQILIRTQIEQDNYFPSYIYLCFCCGFYANINKNSRLSEDDDGFKSYGVTNIENQCAFSTNNFLICFGRKSHSLLRQQSYPHRWKKKNSDFRLYSLPKKHSWGSNICKLLLLLLLLLLLYCIGYIYQYVCVYTFICMYMCVYIIPLKRHWYMVFFVVTDVA